MEITFDEMIGKLRTGEWEKATTHFWQERDGQYVTLKWYDDRMKLLLHEGHDSVIVWKLNLSDVINIKFTELKT